MNTVKIQFSLFGLDADEIERLAKGKKESLIKRGSSNFVKRAIREMIADKSLERFSSAEAKDELIMTKTDAEAKDELIVTTYNNLSTIKSKVDKLFAEASSEELPYVAPLTENEKLIANVELHYLETDIILANDKNYNLEDRRFAADEISYARKGTLIEKRIKELKRRVDKYRQWLAEQVL